MLPKSLAGQFSNQSAAFALAVVLAGLTPARALDGRIGTYVAEGPGAWLQVRHPIGGTDFGVHLAASTIRLDVLLYNPSFGSSLDAVGTTSQTIPGEATALFTEWGVVAARTLHRADRWGFALSTGLMGGLLDGTEDEGGRPLARTMILVPAFLESDWHPWENHQRLGFTLGAGGVWTIPGDDDNLYPEVSAWRWQARTGLIF